MKQLFLSEYDSSMLQPYGCLPCGEPLLYPPFGEHKQWKVAKPFLYISRRGWGVEIEDSFLSDLASIPRLLRIFYGVNKRETCGAVIHDHGYRNRFKPRYNVLTGYSCILSRAEWDEILYDACRLGGTNKFRAWSIYRGVRLGGWVAWYHYNKEYTLPKSLDED